MARTVPTYGNNIFQFLKAIPQVGSAVLFQLIMGRPEKRKKNYEFFWGKIPVPDKGVNKFVQLIKPVNYKFTFCNNYQMFVDLTL